MINKIVTFSPHTSSNNPHKAIYERCLEVISPADINDANINNLQDVYI